MQWRNARQSSLAPLRWAALCGAAASRGGGAPSHSSHGHTSRRHDPLNTTVGNMSKFCG